MLNVQADEILVCEGLACPMPVVRTKKAMDKLEAGKVLEIRATDKGSLADLKSWANRTGHQYIGYQEEGNVYRHFIRKTDPVETKEERKHPSTITNEQLNQKILAGEKLNIIDVREPAEYVFGRIPGAKSIPLGELETRLDELDPNQAYFVICRTGNRSDLACQMMTEKGFSNVTNVIPGMTAWNGEIQK